MKRTGKEDAFIIQVREIGLAEMEKRVERC